MLFAFVPSLKYIREIGWNNIIRVENVKSLEVAIRGRNEGVMGRQVQDERQVLLE